MILGRMKPCFHTFDGMKTIKATHPIVSRLFFKSFFAALTKRDKTYKVHNFKIFPKFCN